MAKSKTLMFSILHNIALTLILISSLAAAVVADEPHHFDRNLSPKSLGLGKEKLTQLRFYMHDVMSGPKPTAVKIAEAQTTNTSAWRFGLLDMADELLTVGPEPDSRSVGRAQGMFGFADQNDLGLVMLLNFAFTEGKYNGSTLSMMGRNLLLTPLREMPIVGGSGVFRFARGYALESTHTLDDNTKDAIVEYNVYVFHY